MILVIPVVAAVKILVVHYWDTRMVWPPPGAGGRGGRWRRLVDVRRCRDRPRGRHGRRAARGRPGVPGSAGSARRGTGVRRRERVEVGHVRGGTRGGGGQRGRRPGVNGAHRGDGGRVDAAQAAGSASRRGHRVGHAVAARARRDERVRRVARPRRGGLGAVRHDEHRPDHRGGIEVGRRVAHGGGLLGCQAAAVPVQRDRRAPCSRPAEPRGTRGPRGRRGPRTAGGSRRCRGPRASRSRRRQRRRSPRRDRRRPRSSSVASRGSDDHGVCGSSRPAYRSSRNAPAPDRVMRLERRPRAESVAERRHHLVAVDQERAQLGRRGERAPSIRAASRAWGRVRPDTSTSSTPARVQPGDRGGCPAR